MAGKQKSSVLEVIHNAGHVAKQSFKTLFKDPQILIYPFLAVIFIGITFLIVNTLVLHVWDKAAHNSIFSVTDAAPHYLKILLGLVTLSFFYTAFVTAYFTCAVSGSVLAKLEKRRTPPLYGLRAVGHRFFRVSKFALLAIFFFPLTLIALRRKFSGCVRGPVEVIGPALSMSIAQLAPVILQEDKSLLASIRQAVDTLGKAWRENLVIKAGMYGALILIGALGFLPKLV